MKKEDLNQPSSSFITNEENRRLALTATVGTSVGKIGQLQHCPSLHWSHSEAAKLPTVVYYNKELLLIRQFLTSVYQLTRPQDMVYSEKQQQQRMFSCSHHHNFMPGDDHGLTKSKFLGMRRR